MAEPGGADRGSGDSDSCADRRVLGFRPDMELMERWMVLDDWGELAVADEHELLSALQPDSTPNVALETLSAFLHSCGQCESSPAAERSAGELDGDADKQGSGDYASSDSTSSTRSGSPSQLLDEFLKLKLADRRRRNRESSSRCYYKRKRKAAAVKEELDLARRRARLLSLRQQQLLKENMSLRKRLSTQYKGAEHVWLLGEAESSSAHTRAAF